MRRARSNAVLHRVLDSRSPGAALVELVVVTPLLLLLLTAVIEVGRYGDYALKVANAARAGVQFGALNTANAGNSNGMKAAAQSDAVGAPGATVVSATEYCVCSAAATTQVACTQAGSGCVTSVDPTNHQIYYVSVQVTGTLSTLTHTTLLPASLQTLNVSNVATMQVAQ